MKKLKLNAFNRGEVLSRAQLKNVMGGGYPVEVIGDAPCSTGVCSNITEDFCCKGLKCVIQANQNAGLCAYE